MQMFSLFHAMNLLLLPYDSIGCKLIVAPVGVGRGKLAHRVRTEQQTSDLTETTRSGNKYLVA